MAQLEQVVQAWANLRELDTQGIVEQVLEIAKEMIEQMLKRQQFDFCLKVYYWQTDFVVEANKDDVAIKKGIIPFARMEKVSIILEKIMEEFDDFTQLIVTKEPFAHQCSQYDIEYAIIIGLKF